MTRFYPVFLNLANRPCIVLGGGAVAEQKTTALLEAGARVTVISAEATPRLCELAARGAIHLRRRPYRWGDLAGTFLAVVGADDRTANRAAWQEAEQRGILINAVDDMPHCNFIAPAIHRQGDLAVAVSTAGKSPALAVRVRNWIAASLGPEYGVFLALLGDLRTEITARIPDTAARTALWYRIVDSDALAWIERGDIAGARRRIAQLIEDAAQNAAGPAPAQAAVRAERGPGSP